ncbi:hypothetical protein Tco_0964209 [Tanacetum coccineum]
MEVNSEGLILGKGRMQRVLVSTLVVFCEEEGCSGVESDPCGLLVEGVIVNDSVLYNDGCIKDCMEKNLERLSW